MKYRDFTWLDPYFNVAADEAILDLAEESGGAGFLRFWEAKEYFVVIGYGNKAAIEADLAQCQRDQVPVIRRCSGGGTVLQGVGCLNYAVVLPIGSSREWQTISSTNVGVMNRHAAWLSAASGEKISVQGVSDLTLGGRKFSGNAQRRKKNYLLFHGTFLYAFDLSLIPHYLPFPSQHPSYREKRSHLDFVMNLPLPRQKIVEALVKGWGCQEIGFPEVWERRTQILAESTYQTEAWNRRF